MFTFATNTHFSKSERDILIVLYIKNSKQIGNNYATKTQIIGKII